MTLADLAEALRRFRVLSIGLFVAIVAAGAAAAILPASRYRAKAVVSVEPISQEVSFDTQQAIQLTVPPTIAQIVSDTFKHSVRLRMAPGNRDEPVAIEATHDPGTAIIDIAVESSTPAAAVDATQAALQRLVQVPRSDRFRVNVVSPPGEASSVKAQRAPPLMIGSVVLGLIVAVLTAAGLHRLLPPLPRADDFRGRFGHDVLGEIPRTRKGHGAGNDHVVDGAASPEMVEAFRSLEALLRRRVAERGADGGPSIVVTSWGTMEGKSTVVAHLACALAAYDREVTVVDCDLRRPRIHTLLGVKRKPGVVDVADGKAVAAVAQQTKLATLDVIAAGDERLARHPAEFAQVAMPRLLAVLGSRVVLVDAPPLFTAETTTIIGQADFVLLVADHRKRRPDDLDAALSELELIGTPLLGVVLNFVDVADTRGRDAYLYQPAGAAPGRR